VALAGVYQHYSARLCTAEVRGSTPLRSVADLQGERAARALRETPREPFSDHSATQIRASVWGWLRLVGTGRDGTCRRRTLRPGLQDLNRA
jgi:hypothetical protein